MNAHAIGIDVGALTLHVVALDAAGALAWTRVIDVEQLEQLQPLIVGASSVAVDAPDRPSALAHSGDPDPKLGAKFRSGRCAEVALGRRRGYWVPFVTPPQIAVGSWMDVGLRVHELARSWAEHTLEVYPHACFRELAGGDRLPPKKRAGGLQQRAGLIRAAGLERPDMEMWSHDSLDAAVAAITARDHAQGEAVCVTCPEGVPCRHDGSAMWLPRAAT